MTTDLDTTQDATVVHPVTGEVLDLATAPIDVIAEFVDAVTDSRRQLDELRSMADRELARRMDVENLRTYDLGGWRVTVNAPTRTVYDGERLRDVLASLVGEGVISESAADRACQQVTTLKPVVRELNKLRSHPEVDTAIESVTSTVDQRRTVKVERRG